MSSTLQITNIGAVIRLATEIAPTKAQAEANPGYLSLLINTNDTRKFSISQHYGSDFTDGLTLGDVLAPNTNYTLYLYFEANAIPSNTTIEGATLVNNKITLPFTTTTLPAAGDPVWNTAWANEQFVGSLPEWGYSENQNGVFVAYTKINLASFTSLALSSRTADNTLSQSIGLFSFNKSSSDPDFLANIHKLDGGSYPDGDNYFYMINADDTRKMAGKILQLEATDATLVTKLKAPLTRYSSP